MLHYQLFVSVVHAHGLGVLSDHDPPSDGVLLQVLLGEVCFAGGLEEPLLSSQVCDALLFFHFLLHFKQNLKPK
jgi:hypothetical protein